MQQNYLFAQVDDIKWKFDYTGLTDVMQTAYDTIEFIAEEVPELKGALKEVHYRRYWLASFVYGIFHREKVNGLDLDNEHDIDLLEEIFSQSFEDEFTSDTIPENIDVDTYVTVTEDWLLLSVELRPEKICGRISP